VSRINTFICHSGSHIAATKERSNQVSKNSPGYQKITPKVIFQLAAPHSWAPASIIPVCFACILALGQGGFSAGLFYMLLCSAVLIHSAVNSLNDYYDFIRGTDRRDNSPEDDDAILVFNNYDPAKVLLVGLGFLLASLALGLYVVLTTNYIPLIIGMIGVATVVAYSSGPHPLSYMPLGEFTSGVVMGILLPIAIYAALTGAMNWRLFYLCLPLMLGIAMIMITNNSCDIERDSEAGRKTLPILLGRSRACALHHALLVVWILMIGIILISDFRAGLFVLPLGLLAGRHSLINLFTATLTPSRRGYHMQEIFKANLWLNGTYTLCVLVNLIRAMAS